MLRDLKLSVRAKHRSSSETLHWPACFSQHPEYGHGTAAAEKKNVAWNLTMRVSSSEQSAETFSTFSTALESGGEVNQSELDVRSNVWSDSFLVRQNKMGPVVLCIVFFTLCYLVAFVLWKGSSREPLCSAGPERKGISTSAV